jgi:hypothetical protein
METIDRRKGALKLDIDTYVVINGPSDGKLPSWVGCYVHPSAGSSIKVRINSKPNFGRVGWVWLHVDRQKSLPRGVNSNTAVARLSCVDICPPADHHLPGVEDDAIEDAPCAADPTFHPI